MHVTLPFRLSIITAATLVTLALGGCGGDDEAGEPTATSTSGTLDAPTAPGVVGSSPLDDGDRSDDDNDADTGTGTGTGSR